MIARIGVGVRMIDVWSVVDSQTLRTEVLCSSSARSRRLSPSKSAMTTWLSAAAGRTPAKRHAQTSHQGFRRIRAAARINGASVLDPSDAQHTSLAARLWGDMRLVAFGMLDS